jgi:hypothetical protein
VVPSPFDPNLVTGITAATITMQVVGAGSITAVICTNNGAPLAQGAITLTPAGAGSNSTIAAVQMLTCTTASVIGTGTNWGGAGLTTTGGAPSVGTITNGPDFLHLSFKPRPLQATVTITGSGSVAGQVGTIIDGGLFEGVPVASTPVGSTVALTMGTTQDIVVLQPFKN